jgi:hypothetical protein
MYEEHSESSQRGMHTVEIAVVLPLLQSVVMSVSVGLAVWFLAWVAMVSRPWVPGLGVGLIVQAVMVVRLFERWMQVSMPLPKQIISQAAEVVQPVREDTPKISIELKQQKQIQLFDLPGDPGDLQQLAQGLLAGRPFTESEWCGSGNVFSRPRFKVLRYTMEKKGLLEVTNPKAPAQGFALTVPGWEVVRALADQAGGGRADSIRPYPTLPDGKSR